MKPLPKSDQALVVRTDFSDDAVWRAIVAKLGEPVDGFFAYVDFVDDAAYRGLTVEQIVELGRPTPKSFVIVVDESAVTHVEHPLLVVDLLEEPGRTFRAIPSQIQGIENNLSIANMDFREFADSADRDGIFRGFT